MLEASKNDVTSFYTVMTTICAFLSLIFSGIKPIIRFWMDDDIRFNCFIIMTFLYYHHLLNIFSSEKEINIKDTEKSLITLLFASIAKKTILLFLLTFYF